YTMSFRFIAPPAARTYTLSLHDALPIFWVPSHWDLLSEEARDKADRTLEKILAQARPAELIVAWRGYAERILAARKVPVTDLNRSEEHTSELQSLAYLVCRLLLEKKK